MKTSITLALILAMLVFVAEAYARPNLGKSPLLSNDDLEVESDFAETSRQHTRSGRKTRHSRQTYPGYTNLWSNTYESHYLLLLEEINIRLKLISEQLSSRTTPCPAVVPYPQYYPLPIKIRNMTSIPIQSDLNNRFGEPIWGFVPDIAVVPNDGDDGDDDDEGSRPISFKPSKESIPAGVHAPPVEHGSVQGEKSTTQKPVSTTKEPKKISPTICHAAILSCCRLDEPERETCFKKNNCSNTYETGKACLKEVISKVIQIFIDAYKPR